MERTFDSLHLHQKMRKSLECWAFGDFLFSDGLGCGLDPIRSPNLLKYCCRILGNPEKQQFVWIEPLAVHAQVREFSVQRNFPNQSAINNREDTQRNGAAMLQCPESLRWILSMADLNRTTVYGLNEIDNVPIVDSPPISFRDSPSRTSEGAKPIFGLFLDEERFSVPGPTLSAPARNVRHGSVNARSTLDPAGTPLQITRHITGYASGHHRAPVSMVTPRTPSRVAGAFCCLNYTILPLLLPVNLYAWMV
jgi:hypothetical protein